MNETTVAMKRMKKLDDRQMNAGICMTDDFFLGLY
jgi:hypothetical protein